MPRRQSPTAGATRRPACRVVAVMACLGSPVAAMGQVHATDIIARVEAGRVQTGSTDPTDPTLIVWNTRVFAGTFGEFANFTDDPGIDSPAGAFPPGAAVGVTVLGALRRWDGAGFDEIPAERLQLKKSTAVFVTPITDECGGGILFGTALSTGKVHQHAGFTLLEPAAAGIYLLPLRLWTDAAGAAESDPIWIVFNQNSPVETHAAALAWVRANLAPNTCRADLDASGSLDFFDFILFQDLFSLGDPRADFEPDCELNFFDFILFQDAFAAGC